MKDAPATKSDIHRLEGKIDTIDSRLESIDSRFESIDSRFESIDSKFESFDSRFESINSRFTRTLALEIGKTHHRMDLMETRLKDEMRQLNSNIITRLDSWAGRMETIWRESALFPRLLDEHGSTLRDHESRLRRLES